MTESDKRPVTLEELLVSSLAQADALGERNLMQKISEERATYQKLLNPTAQ
jgi:hypothetical protein